MAALPGRRGKARRDLTTHGRRRGVGARAVRSARTFLWSLHPGGVDIAPRWTLEDSIQTRRHPLGIVAVVAIVIIIIVGGFFFMLPPLPGFGSTRV